MTELAKWEADAFVLIVEFNTRYQDRLQLSFAVQRLRFKPTNAVIDGFQGAARRMWKTIPLAGNGPSRTARP